MEINEMCKRSNELAHEKGWYEGGARNIGEVLALMHSELSEALEEWRNRKMNIYYREDGKPEGFPIELADVVIRVGDTCAELGIDLEAAINLKHEFNKSRSYRHGGKAA